MRTVRLSMLINTYWNFSKDSNWHTAEESEETSLSTSCSLSVLRHKEPRRQPSFTNAFVLYKSSSFVPVSEPNWFMIRTTSCCDNYAGDNKTDNGYDLKRSASLLYGIQTPRLETVHNYLDWTKPKLHLSEESCSSRIHRPLLPVNYRSRHDKMVMKLTTTRSIRATHNALLQIPAAQVELTSPAGVQ